MEQKILGLQPQVVPDLELLPEWMLNECSDIECAAKVCMRESRTKRDDKTWAELLGIRPGDFSLILNKPKNNLRPRYFRGEWITDIESWAGNLGITQWLAFQRNKTLTTATLKQIRIRELEDELAGLMGTERRESNRRAG